MCKLIPYNPRDLQRLFHDKRTRFCVMLCHRRFGKTVAAINDLLRQAIIDGRSDWRGAYLAPYCGQAKALVWDYLKHFAQNIPKVKFNESELRCDLPSGGRIRLFGTDNANALRGLYLDDVVFDEPADMPAEIWTRIIRPMLADRQGRALFLGTPKGTNNLLFKVWEEAGENYSGLWSRFCFKVSQTKYIAAEELKAIKKSMTPEDYAQEFECSFTAAIKGAYYANALEELESKGRIKEIEYTPHLPVNTAWDLGMSDATAIWFFQVEPSGDWRIIDYHENSGEGLSYYINYLQSKKYVYAKHIAPHDIRVRELGTGISRLEMAASLGIKFCVAPQLSIADGINAVRSHLPRLWFDKNKCKLGLASLKNYRKEWKAKYDTFAVRPVHDWTSHAADALRYAITGYRPVLDMSNCKRRAHMNYNIF